MLHLLADGPYCKLLVKWRVIADMPADIVAFIFIQGVEGQVQLYNKIVSRFFIKPHVDPYLG